MAAVHLYGPALQHAGAELRYDPDVVLTAVRAPQSPRFHRWPCLNFQRNYTHPYTRPSGDALQFAHASLRTNKKIVEAAVNRSPAALQYASHALRSDRKFLLGLLESSPDAVRFVAPECLEDSDFLVDVLVRQPATADILGGMTTRKVADARISPVVEALIAAIDRNSAVAYELSKRNWSGEMRLAIAEAHVWSRDLSDSHDPALIVGIGSSDWQQCDGWKKYDCPCGCFKTQVHCSWEPEEVTLKEELRLEKRLDSRWRHKKKGICCKRSVLNHLRATKPLHC